VGAPTVEGAKVVCEVQTPLVKGEKVIVFKKKRRKGYRRKNGHRQYFTKVLIKEVVA
ncbi:MAG: 50S ribosomal protein L21, partial [Bacteroides sp.]|nr:50S ribosomal protein L21 [Bacteroides sp.]